MRVCAILAILLCCFGATAAQAYHPFQQGFVNTTQVLDYAGAMSQRAIGELKELAEDTEYFTGHPMMLLTVPDLKGWKPEYYAAVAARDMGVLDPGKPGVLLFVSKKELTGNIALGPGIERWVTPEIVQSIMREDVFPNLKKGDLQTALAEGAWSLSAAVQGKYKTKEQKLREYMPLLIIFPVLILFYLIFGEGKASRLNNIFGGAWGRW